MLTFWIRRRPADRGGARLRARSAAARRGRRPAPPSARRTSPSCAASASDIESDVARRPAAEGSARIGAGRARRPRGGGSRRLRRGARRPCREAVGRGRAFFAVLIPVAAVGVYLWVGAARGAPTRRVMAAARAQPGDHQIEEMVVALEQKMKERPDDVQGWMPPRALLRRHGQDAQGAGSLRAPREDRAAGRQGARRLRRRPGARARAEPRGRAHRARQARACQSTRAIPRRWRSPAPRSSTAATSPPRSPTGSACAPRWRRGRRTRPR